MEDHGQEELLQAIVDFATPLRMGEGIDEITLGRLRRELANGAAAWREGGGRVPSTTAAALVELYPAMYGASALYEDGYDKRVLDLAEDLLVEVLSALGAAG